MIIMGADDTDNKIPTVITMPFFLNLLFQIVLFTYAHTHTHIHIHFTHLQTHIKYISLRYALKFTHHNILCRRTITSFLKLSQLFTVRSFRDE